MSKKVNHPKSFFLILIICSIVLMSSCVDWDDGGDWNLIRTDIRVHVTVTDFITNAPIANQQVDWSIHLYSGVTVTDNDLKTGTITTDANGQAEVPVYECMLASGIIARIMAFTPEQANDEIEPYSVTYDEALNVANEDNYALIDVDYTIRK